jgi:hypothetical protein
MLASDLAAALALYNEYTGIKTVRDLLTTENVGAVDLKFLNHATPASTVATSVLTDNGDVNDVVKAVRRQMLVDLNVIKDTLRNLGVDTSGL